MPIPVTQCHVSIVGLLSQFKKVCVVIEHVCLCTLSLIKLEVVILHGPESFVAVSSLEVPITVAFELASPRAVVHTRCLASLQ